MPTVCPHDKTAIRGHWKTIFNKHLTPTMKNESAPFPGGGRLKEHRGKQQQHLHFFVFIYLAALGLVVARASPVVARGL